MNIKEIFFIILGIAIVFAGGYFLYSKNIGVVNAPAQEGIKIEDKKITDKEKPFNIDITYPYIAGLDDFNKKSEDLVNNNMTEFKSLSLENDAAVKETDPENYAKYPREYYLGISYDKGLVDDNTISVVFNISNFTGGAHGANYFSSLNYDVKNKKEILLADLFGGQTDYLQKISDYCKADLKKQILERTEGQDEGWVDEGAGPKEENFSVFLINKDNIVFYFPQYQVAAYAVGDFKVTMPK